MVHCFIGFKQNVFWRFPKQRAHTRFLWKFSFSWRRWIPGPSVTITKCLYLTNHYTYLYENFRKVRYSYKFLFARNLNFKYKKLSICEAFEFFFSFSHISFELQNVFVQSVCGKRCVLERKIDWCIVWLVLNNYKYLKFDICFFSSFQFI